MIAIRSHRPRQAPRRTVVAALAAVFALLAAGAAGAVDWSAAPTRDVPVFHPGQASWEWALTEKDHSGAPKFRGGKNCRGCHDGEQADMGKRIASGEKLEPHPVAGSTGSNTLKVAAARDDARLYLRLRWKPAASEAAPMDPAVAARVTVMFDDGQIKEATRAGCWASCHDDAMGMASAPAGAEITKYLGASRAKMGRSGGGAAAKPAADIDALLAQGTFLEYWQAQLNPGKPAVPVNGWVLDKRHQQQPATIGAEAEFANGEWTVVLSRALAPAGSGQKALAPGKTYTLGFALHDHHANHRFHLVSLEYTLVLDQGTADLVATKR
jgi:cytochrome c-type protein NapC